MFSYGSSNSTKSIEEENKGWEWGWGWREIQKRECGRVSDILVRDQFLGPEKHRRGGWVSLFCVANFEELKDCQTDN